MISFLNPCLNLRETGPIKTRIKNCQQSYYFP